MNSGNGFQKAKGGGGEIFHVRGKKGIERSEQIE